MSELPEDGGKIFPDGGGTVITQPSAGVYKALRCAPITELGA